MTRLDRLLRGSARVEISGAAPASCLNALDSAGVRWSDAESVDAFTLRLSVPARQLRAAENASARSQCELRLLAESGVPVLRRRLRRRIAALAAGAICFAALAASSLFVWEIDVAGNETVSTGEILRSLAEHGARSGSFWPGWDTGNMANSVILDIPELAWVGISVRGSVAEVRVRERTPPPGQASAPGSILAGAQGIIERMEVFAGAALVSVGDTVSAGQELVSSAAGPERYVRASAKITARTFHELTASAPLEAQELTEAGSYTRWALIVGERRFNFYAGSSQTPVCCGKISEEFPLAVEGVFTLPVKLVRERVVEYSAESAAEDAGALELELTESLYAELERRLDGRGEVISSDVAVSESGGALYVTLRAECREDIAVFKPAEEKGTDTE